MKMKEKTTTEYRETNEKKNIVIKTSELNIHRNYDRNTSKSIVYLNEILWVMEHLKVECYIKFKKARS